MSLISRAMTIGRDSYTPTLKILPPQPTIYSNSAPPVGAALIGMLAKLSSSVASRNHRCQHFFLALSASLLILASKND